jgi:precorrin-6B methylase 2
VAVARRRARRARAAGGRTLVQHAAAPLRGLRLCYALRAEMSQQAAAAPAPSLAPFNPTADDAIQAALAFLALRAGDALLDLGCGDGRLLLAAALACPGVACVGYEYDAAVHARGMERLARAREAGGAGADAAARVALHLGDACRAPTHAATAAFVYLVPAGLARVQQGLLGVLERGGRVVSNMFKVPGLEAYLRERHLLRGAPLYCYSGPAASVAEHE